MRGEHAIELGDVVEVLRGVEANSFDAVLCDPPYGLSFMGKRWDYDVPSAELWREVLRVCKPGAPLIAFSGTRTYHRTVVQIEDAGFEIRDQLAWMYGSGFPKSLDVSKAIDKARSQGLYPIGHGAMKADGDWNVTKNRLTMPPATTEAAQLWHGYGTALKPAYEPAVLARKPLDGTVAQNVAKWGVGALAIDASRIEGEKTPAPTSRGDSVPWFTTGDAANLGGDDSKGRWPANVLLDEEAGAALDAQTGIQKSGTAVNKNRSGVAPNEIYGKRNAPTVDAGYGDSGGASRFFYCAKASKRERDMGCGDLPVRTGGDMTDREDGSDGLNSPRAGAGRGGGSRNHHPTVKPIALMTYLARLIMPPNPGAILVPFSGSGSEMIGCLRAGWPGVVGIEREVEYVEIARRRLKAA